MTARMAASSIRFVSLAPSSGGTGAPAAARAPTGTTTAAADDQRRQRRELALQVQLVDAPFAALCQHVCSLTGLARVEAWCLAGQLLCLQLLGAPIPVGDLLGQPLVDGGTGAVDAFLDASPDLVEVCLGEVLDAVVEGALLDPVAGQPRSCKDVPQPIDLLAAGGAVVEVGRRPRRAGRAISGQLDELQRRDTTCGLPCTRR